jgi:ArsR family transcriptional regulator
VNTKIRNLPANGLTPEIMAGFQAIAEPTRARIVALLGHGEHCVCDVGETLALSPALVSHHLRALRDSGLLRERRSGRWVYYSLDLDALERLRAAINGLLTPTDETAASCLCSDCGPERGSRPPTPRLPDFGSFRGATS